MIILVKLILAHLLGDFLLQPKSWVNQKENKKVKSFKLYSHGLIHAILVLLILWNISYWSLALSIMIIHLIIDIIKLYAQNEKTKSLWFIIDQLLHIVSILILWIIWFYSEISLVEFYNNEIFWLYLTAITFLTIVCGVVIQNIMSNWSKEIENDKDKSLPSAGKYIGILERLLVFTFIVFGHWEAIGFLVAAKSVLRFGDLKNSENRKLTEYILVGTLLSFGIAIATGLGVVYLTSTII
ncbi:MAG: hypothetical protein CR986_02955 [Ignavibacteriae bacterium]|nr:MAG: hypothetical protein CR986_02955 [Ignavibacteriota bacterium]